jgi:mRNA-degrading endonuclease RelE of RelBE toxin-antitoxin system
MKTRVELDPQVVDFVRSLAPEPRRHLRAALRALEREGGDLQPLEAEVSGYWRLRVGSYRVVVRLAVERRTRIARCVFAERRSVVYELLAELLSGASGRH